MSFRALIYYVDLDVRSGVTLEDAVTEARRLAESRRASGLGQTVLDEAARRGFASAAFEELDEDVPVVVEEFFTPQGTTEAESATGINRPASLRSRLEAKAFGLEAT